eukprot:2991614-Pleurochrysis_carterae.AAC.1
MNGASAVSRGGVAIGVLELAIDRGDVADGRSVPSPPACKIAVPAAALGWLRSMALFEAEALVSAVMEHVVAASVKFAYEPLYGSEVMISARRSFSRMRKFMISEQ